MASKWTIVKTAKMGVQPGLGHESQKNPEADPMTPTLDWESIIKIHLFPPKPTKEIDSKNMATYERRKTGKKTVRCKRERKTLVLLIAPIWLKTAQNRKDLENKVILPLKALLKRENKTKKRQIDSVYVGVWSKATPGKILSIYSKWPRDRKIADYDFARDHIGEGMYEIGFPDEDCSLGGAKTCADILGHEYLGMPQGVIHGAKGDTFDSLGEAFPFLSRVRLHAMEYISEEIASVPDLSDKSLMLFARDQALHVLPEGDELQEEHGQDYCDEEDEEDDEYDNDESDGGEDDEEDDD